MGGNLINSTPRRTRIALTRRYLFLHRRLETLAELDQFYHASIPFIKNEQKAILDSIEALDILERLRLETGLRDRINLLDRATINKAGLNFEDLKGINGRI